MNNILALLQPIQNSVSKTTLRQMSRIIIAMLSMTGRVTMLGLSRWAEKEAATDLKIKGESYRFKEKRRAGLLGRQGAQEQEEPTEP